MCGSQGMQSRRLVLQAPCFTCYLVAPNRPHAGAKDFVSEENLTYRFRLVKFWELEAADFLTADVHLLPYVVLMRGGLARVDEIDRRILETSALPNEEKWDLLTVLDIYTGMHDRKLAQALGKKRRELMIESPIYREILEEGLSKGRAEGEAEGLRKGQVEGARKAKLETAKAMLAEGIAIETVLRVTGLDRESLEGSAPEE